jgi:protein SDA1
MMELYKKNIWNDAKTVNVIAEACFSDHAKLVAPAVHFFLGTNDNVDEDSDEETADLSSMRHANTVNRKTKARKAQIDKAMAAVKKKERAKNRAEHFNFSALHLINDPQGFAEHLFSRLKQVTKSNVFKFDLRLNIINLVPHY